MTALIDILSLTSWVINN